MKRGRHCIFKTKRFCLCRCLFGLKMAPLNINMPNRFKLLRTQLGKMAVLNIFTVMSISFRLNSAQTSTVLYTLNKQAVSWNKNVSEITAGDFCCVHLGFSFKRKVRLFVFLPCTPPSSFCIILSNFIFHTCILM